MSARARWRALLVAMARPRWVIGGPTASWFTLPPAEVVRLTLARVAARERGARMAEAALAAGREWATERAGMVVAALAGRPRAAGVRRPPFSGFELVAPLPLVTTGRAAPAAWSTTAYEALVTARRTTAAAAALLVPGSGRAIGVAAIPRPY